jgi:hypothetical protein
MALPTKTTTDDVRGIVNYFKTKPTGATLTEARAAIDKKLLDGRKIAAYRAWKILDRDGDRYKLTPRGWDLARKPETEAQTYRQIIDSIVPYRSALEWMFHQGFDNVSVIDVAAHWHEHHASALGPDVKDATIRDNAVAFFHLCEAAGVGKLTLGRGGNPTRLVIDRPALTTYIEAGPTAPTTELGETVEEDEDVEVEAEQQDEELPPTPPPAPPAAPEKLRAFIAHGANMEIVDQVQTMLSLADIDSEVAESEETPAIPVPDKVLEAMRRCQAGIIAVSADERYKNESGDYTINENVLIEIGAAFVLYDRRVVLLWDKRLPVPSNLQGLYRCEYEGDELSWSAGMKLMKAIQGFKR